MENTLPDQLSIKQLIRQVQDELRASQIEREAQGQAALFAIDKLSIEINFVVTESTDLKGGIDLKIVTAGAGSQYVQQQVHKITLSLKANSSDSQDSGFQDLEGQGLGALPRGGY